MTPPDAVAAVAAVAVTPRLLVACDYDGTLSELVPDPARAVPVDGAMAVLRELAGLPGTTVALLSGRSLQSLASLSGAPAGVLLVGSHGLEHGRPQTRLGDGEAALLARARAELVRLSAGLPCALVEDKPAGVSLHVRRCPPEVGDRLLAEATAGPGSWPGIHRMPGKMVVELSVRPLGKGAALLRLAAESSATAVLVAGDDVTDEEAFTAAAGLGVEAVTVKVGPGGSRAAYRVDGPAGLPPVLAEVARIRSARE